MQPEHRMAVERKVFEGHPTFLRDMLYEYDMKTATSFC